MLAQSRLGDLKPLLCPALVFKIRSLRRKNM